MSCSCVNEHSAVLHSQTHSTFISIMKMQPLRFSNHTKPYCDFGFILMHHAALCYSIFSTGSYQTGLLITNKTLTFKGSLNTLQRTNPSKRAGFSKSDWQVWPALQFALITDDLEREDVWGQTSAGPQCSAAADGPHTPSDRCGRRRREYSSLRQHFCTNSLTHTAANAERLWILTQWRLHNHLH